MRGVGASFASVRKGVTVNFLRNRSSPAAAAVAVTTAAVAPAARAAVAFATTSSMSFRKVAKVLKPNIQGDGDGAVVSRSIGRAEQSELDPFLLFDEATVKLPAGFPDHPHRGFETVSYLLKGSFKHEDFAGHKGELHPGDLQWMTAGKGIVHSEMPGSYDECRGLQLWVNLPAADKMCDPAYQELKAKDIPIAEKDGVKVKVIAGTSLGITSPVYTRTPTAYLDFTMAPGSHLVQDIPEGWNAFVYTLQGSIVLGTEDSAQIAPRHTVILERSGSALHAWNKSGEESRFVLIAGKPLGEPVARYGPFVMSTHAELEQAFQDYRMARNGFEKVRTWKSTNRVR